MFINAARQVYKFKACFGVSGLCSVAGRSVEGKEAERSGLLTRVTLLFSCA